MLNNKQFLKMYKISDEVIKFIDKTMKTWTVGQTTTIISLGKVKIHSYIPQRCSIPITY